MKRLAYAFLILLAVKSFSFAIGDDFSDYPRGSFNTVPSPNSKVTEAVYISTIVSLNTATPGGQNVIISSPSYVHAVVISSPGVGGSFFELFDAMATTATQSNARPILKVDTTRTSGWNPVTLQLNTFCSSGTAINNSGATPAIVEVIYRER